MKTTLKKIWFPMLTMAVGAALVFAARAASDKPAPASVVVDEKPLVRDSRTSFAPVVKEVAPAVVNIFTTKTVKAPSARDLAPFFDDPLFKRFFGERPNSNEEDRPRTRKERSLGSGVIVTKDGYVLTNSHVVDGADEIKVSMAKAGEKEYTAKLIGKDTSTDIAVLKIEDGNSLPFAKLADSDKVEVGDVVLAIGNPFGLGQTVTSGIVSAMGRSNMGIEDYEDFIQTDAAINPGNSGGALIDAQGRLIGINTAILSRTGGNQGIGFAIPINLVHNMMDQLIQNGHVTRGYLGVQIQSLTPELAKQFNVPSSNGALVGDVTADSAAAAAGVKSGDVIIKLDGKPVQDSGKLRWLVAQKAPNSKVELTVIRQGKEKSITVTLKERPTNLASTEKEELNGESDALNGVTVGDLTDDVRRQFNIPLRIRQGAVITEIDQSSASFEAGLRAGQVILEIDRQPIKNAEEAVEASKHVKGDKVLVRITSRAGSQYIVVDESKSKEKGKEK